MLPWKRNPDRAQRADFWGIAARLEKCAGTVYPSILHNRSFVFIPASLRKIAYLARFLARGKFPGKLEVVGNGDNNSVLGQRARPCVV